MTSPTPEQSSAELYRNKKNSKIYQVYLRVVDCTNGREDTPMIVYGLEGGPPRFVRDAAEFAVKFEPLAAGGD